MSAAAPGELNRIGSRAGEAAGPASGLLVRLVPLGVVLLGSLLLPGAAMPGLLAAGVFAVATAVGAAFFAAILGATGSSFWRPIRSVPISIAKTLLVGGALLAFTIAAGLRVLYPWADPARVAASHAMLAKTAWLSPPLFLARMIVVLLAFLGAITLLGDRIDLAASPKLELRRRFGRTAVLAILILAPATAVFFWDTTMSLEPEWFSTMYAVYGFAGAFVSGIAAITLLALLRDSGRPPEERMTESLRHDLGKLLFAFSTFWAYIWFCQYLLIWYTNIPEEVPHYLVRLRGDFALPFCLLPFLSFVVPFSVLLSARAKKSPAVLFEVALVVLAGRVLEAWLMVVPAVGAPLSGTAFLLLGLAVLLLPTGYLLVRRELAPPCAD